MRITNGSRPSQALAVYEEMPQLLNLKEQLGKDVLQTGPSHGFTEPSQRRRAIEEGWVFRDGKVPINVSAGLKTEGHTVGAHGVSQLVVATLQLTDPDGAMQLGTPRRGAVQSMGGQALITPSSCYKPRESTC